MTILKRLNDGGLIVLTKLKKKTYLNNTEAATHPDYGVVDCITAEAGEPIKIWVQPYADGRVYYTAFRRSAEGVYYCRTQMKKNGQFFRNCGGALASLELKKMLG